MKTPLPLITLIAFTIVICIIAAFQNPREEQTEKPETLGELHTTPDTGLKQYGAVVYDAENFM